MDPLSLVAEHCADSGHTFAFQNAEILGRGCDRVARKIIEDWQMGTTSSNRCVTLPRTYQAPRTQLSEQKSQREHGPNVHPHIYESMADTHAIATQLKPENCKIIASASSTTYPAAIRRRDPLSLMFAHALEFDHRYIWDGTVVDAMAANKQARESFEASLNRHVDLDSRYEGLRARLTDLRPQPNNNR
ncbi:unnamed protein product [Schistocephalus solidus]|uniref:PNPLA domain-containing protein n=1 Tax=Schistocephalus solidus TaxID=70667 RepID=A0A183T8C7_SCHSO|nr:unnamed protein product [Schistocephalus solidus]